MAGNLRKIFSVFPINELKSSQLPTEADIISAILFEKSKQTNKTNIKEICRTVALQVEKIWQKSIIPTNE